MEQPKYKLGEEVSVDFIGTIKGIYYTFKGDIEYRIEGNDCNATVREHSILPLIIPGGSLTCLICHKTFPDKLSFHEHLFENTHLKPDHTIDTYHAIAHRRECPYCGGQVRTMKVPPDGWETTCLCCDFLFDED